MPKRTTVKRATAKRATVKGAAAKGAAANLILRNLKLPAEVATRIRRDLFSGKGMDACHRKIRAETGIWIPELEPVFKKLDQILGLPKR